MSVAELHPSEDPGPDRTPPNDIAAEQSVLGAMLLSKDAIADVVEVLREGDFYRPAHAVVYAAILDLYGRGEPADAVTVAAELAQTGEHRPGRRRAVPAHARLDGAHGGQRRLLRTHRPRAGHPAPPRRGRHPHRVDGLHRHRRRRPHGRPRPGRGLRRHRPAHERGLRAAAATSWATRSTRSRRSPTAAARWSACRPGSPTSTSSPTACTPGSSSSSRPGRLSARRSRSTRRSPRRPAGRPWARSGSATCVIGDDGLPVRVTGVTADVARPTVLPGHVLRRQRDRRRRRARVAHR